MTLNKMQYCIALEVMQYITFNHDYNPSIGIIEGSLFRDKCPTNLRITIALYKLKQIMPKEDSEYMIIRQAELTTKIKLTI